MKNFFLVLFTLICVNLHSQEVNKVYESDSIGSTKSGKLVTIKSDYNLTFFMQNDSSLLKISNNDKSKIIYGKVYLGETYYKGFIVKSFTGIDIDTQETVTILLMFSNSILISVGLNKDYLLIFSIKKTIY